MTATRNLPIDDARSILSTSDLIAAGVRGEEVRRRMHGVRTTFVRVYEVHVDAVPSEPAASVVAGELRIVGRPADPDAAIASTRAAALLALSISQASAHRVPLTGFSLADLRSLNPSVSDLAALCDRLHDAGLEA